MNPKSPFNDANAKENGAGQGRRGEKRGREGKGGEKTGREGEKRGGEGSLPKVSEKVLNLFLHSSIFFSFNIISSLFVVVVVMFFILVYGKFQPIYCFSARFQLVFCVFLIFYQVQFVVVFIFISWEEVSTSLSFFYFSFQFQQGFNQFIVFVILVPVKFEPFPNLAINSSQF